MKARKLRIAGKIKRRSSISAPTGNTLRNKKVDLIKPLEWRSTQAA